MIRFDFKKLKKIGRKKDVGESAHKNSNSGMQIMSIMTAKTTSV